MATMRSTLDLLQELGKRAGADLAPDQNGVVSITVGSDVTLALEAQEGSPFVHFHAPIRRLDRTGRTADLEAALRANLFALPLSGAWLALDDGSDELLLCFAALARDLTADRLGELIEAFAVALRDVRSAPTASQGGAGERPGFDDAIQV